MEKEVRRKQKNCGFQKGEWKNTCLRGWTGDPASSGERKTGRGIKKKIKKAEEKREENKVLYPADGEGEEYMSEGKDWRPFKEWRGKQTLKPAGEGVETVEKMKKAETEAEEKTETEILETQKLNC